MYKTPWYFINHFLLHWIFLTEQTVRGEQYPSSYWLHYVLKQEAEYGHHLPDFWIQLLAVLCFAQKCVGSKNIWGNLHETKEGKICIFHVLNIKQCFTLKSRSIILDLTHFVQYLFSWKCKNHPKMHFQWCCFKSSPPIREQYGQCWPMGRQWMLVFPSESAFQAMRNGGHCWVETRQAPRPLGTGAQDCKNRRN